MRRPPSCCLHLFLFAVFLLPAVSSQARVSLRWGAARNTSDALAALGGALAYEADIDINSGTGHLLVYGFEGGINALLPGLRSQFDKTAFSAEANQNSALRVVTVERDDGILRLVLAHLPLHDKTIIFAMEQTGAAFRDAQRVPALSELQKWGPLPVATPTFYARDARIGMAMMVGESNLRPEGIHDVFLAELRSGGWVSALPPSLQSSQIDSQFAVHVKGELTCISLAAQDPTSGITRITVLHKQPGLN